MSTANCATPGFSIPTANGFSAAAKDIKAAINAVRKGQQDMLNRSLAFGMRPEQAAAVEKTAAYFRSHKHSGESRPPHFLWNAKMRFGKTFATYKLAQEMGWKKVLVLTFKPAVQSAWEEDLKTHVDFEGWQFISPSGLTFEEADPKKPIVCFGSFQDYLGRNKSTGGIKTKNEWVHSTNWDAVVFDEYHFGAWRENAKELFEGEDKKELAFAEGELPEDFDEDIMPITTDAYLYLSGTPFRAITSGEFIEEQIFNWTYTDEQSAKEGWTGPNNPYASLPRMVLMTYQLPDSIREVISGGEFNEFDLNVFFGAEGSGQHARFSYEEEVQKWLNMIRGSFSDGDTGMLKLGKKKPPLPFSDGRLLNLLSHTFWFLPNVASCHAMENLLKAPANKFFHEYKIVVAAGTAAGIGLAALASGAGGHGRSAQDQDDHAFLWEVNNRSLGQAVDGYFHAAQCVQPGDLFPSRLSGANSVDDPQPGCPGAGNHPQRGMLRLRFCPQSCLASDRRLQLPSQSGRIQSREKGGRLYQLPARAGLRWQFHAAD
jgi:hypothetical protein